MVFFRPKSRRILGDSIRWSRGRLNIGRGLSGFEAHERSHHEPIHASSSSIYLVHRGSSEGSDLHSHILGHVWAFPVECGAVTTGRVDLDAA